MFTRAKLMTESGLTGEQITFTAGLEEIETTVKDWTESYARGFPWEFADVSIWPDEAAANSGTNPALNFRLVL